ncbi:ATP-grasp fold amidoligase family protein [Helicobacter sp. 23-1044]
MPKLYGVWECVEAIDFDILPNSFVLKTNHDGGGVVLVSDKNALLRDKSAFKSAMKKLKKHLATNYYTLYREWHYKNITPRVFAEEMLYEKFENGDFQYPSDYKVHCFGECAYIQVDTERFTNHTRTIFNAQWEKMECEYLYPTPKNIPPHPQNLALMLQIATHLSAQIAYLRVDLYNCGCVVVGELTLTPEGGTGRFSPNSWDEKLGALWK